MVVEVLKTVVMVETLVLETEEVVGSELEVITVELVVALNVVTVTVVVFVGTEKDLLGIKVVLVLVPDEDFVVTLEVVVT